MVRKITLALIPKGSCESDEFISNLVQGGHDRAEQEGIIRTSNGTASPLVHFDCISRLGYSQEGKYAPQGDIITDLINSGAVNGIAVIVWRAEQVEEAIAAAVQAGIPVVTVDSDAPDSQRAVYIGTDNEAMGREMGKVLVQLKPQGGKYAVVRSEAGNLILREQGLHRALAGSTWAELKDVSPIVPNETESIFELMSSVVEATLDLDAILPLSITPMKDPDEWAAFADRYKHRLTFVGTDWEDFQLDLLSRGYVNGLVGQLPYGMGEQTVSTLLQLVRHEQGSVASAGIISTDTVFGTNMIEILRVPINLPLVNFDYNHLGSTTILGYVAFSILAFVSIGFAAWTFLNHEKYVVKASQPFFLYLICAGTLIFASSIIAFGIDDNHYSQSACNIACMSVPWLITLGFVLIFSALFSKTWRVNKIFHQPNKFKRMKVTTQDVILPMLVLLTANVIILSCFTALSPLKFIRTNTGEIDLWNRSVASEGRCHMTSSSVVYLSLLGVVNFCALALAIVEAYKARNIETEFSESRYIGLVIFSIAQAIVVGGPILALQRKESDPIVSYVLVTLLVFLLTIVILLLLFVPKYLFQRERDATKREKKIRITGLHDGSDSSKKSSKANHGVSIKIWKQVTPQSEHTSARSGLEDSAEDEGMAPIAVHEERLSSRMCE